MMKKILSCVLLLILMETVVAGGADSNRLFSPTDLKIPEAIPKATDAVVPTPAAVQVAEESLEENSMRITIHDEIFTAVLDDNETAAAFAALLPMTLAMEELNGNEIYHYLMGPLPSAPEHVGHVDAGDIMLFGDSCVVIFYESFDTPYTYTRIGRIEDTERLREAIGGKDCQVGFE